VESVVESVQISWVISFTSFTVLERSVAVFVLFHFADVLIDVALIDHI